MKIEDIKDQALKTLFLELKHASDTIEYDGQDALSESKNDEELIENWQSKLMDLGNECQHFSGTHENMKSGKQGAGIDCVKNPEIKCFNKVTTPAPECADVPVCEMGRECQGKGL